MGETARTGTVTVDTGEWKYIDKFGIGHKVTNGQTFTLNISDDGTDDIQYYIPAAQSVTTDDGYVINFRPGVTNAAGGNVRREIETLDDTIPGQGFQHPLISGELDIECPVSGEIQHWRVSKLVPSDTDFTSSGSIECHFEDQFGNTMFWKAGMDVAI